MNNLLLTAGAVGLFTTALHIFGGQITLIRPLLQSTLASDVKACLLVCWHTVSAYLLLTSGLYLFAGLNPPAEPTQDIAVLLNAISSFYLLFTALFIVIGWTFFGYRTLYKLPQWTLLLPIGVLGLLGTTNS